MKAKLTALFQTRVDVFKALFKIDYMPMGPDPDLMKMAVVSHWGDIYKLGNTANDYDIFVAQDPDEEPCFYSISGVAENVPITKAFPEIQWKNTLWPVGDFFDSEEEVEPEGAKLPLAEPTPNEVMQAQLDAKDRQLEQAQNQFKLLEEAYLKLLVSKERAHPKYVATLS